jgi:thymidylate kinase
MTLKLNLKITLVDGIDGAGKSTFIRDMVFGPQDGNTYVFQQKFPTVYPTNWDTVEPNFFLQQMREEKMGINQIIYWLRERRHELEGEVNLKLYVDRSFYSTAAYANDLQSFVDGLEVLQDSIASFKYVLPERDPIIEVKVTALWMNTPLHECMERIHRREVMDETKDPFDDMDEKAREARLHAVRDVYQMLYIVTHMNLNRRPLNTERLTSVLIKPLEFT